MGISDDLSKIKLALTRYRDRAGLTLRELSDRAGVDHATICNLEKGRIKPNAKAVEKLTKALSLTAEEKLELEQLLAALPEFRLVKTRRPGTGAKLAIRSFAMLAEVAENEIREAWLLESASNDFDVILVLRDNKAAGVKLGGARSLFIAMADSMDVLPPLRDAVQRQIALLPA